MKTSPKKKTIKKIKSSVFSRTLSLAKLSVSAGVQIAGQGLNSLLKDQDEKKTQWNKFLQNQARVFTKEVGELKGSIMKAGQMLSMYGEHFLPPEVNSFLRSLHQDSVALEWKAIEKILKQELGTEKLSLLEVETEALACASLGQVHKAKIKSTGEAIVLKIQYPNVDKAIESDLKSIRSFLSLVKLLPNNKNLDPLFEEIRNMLVQETDYIQEAKSTEFFKAKLADDPRFIVPKVISEFSNKKILATSFEQGLRIDDPVIQSLSLERRNHLAATFLDLYFKELFLWKIMQTDPHFGNYRIRIHPEGKDQIVLFDFGATRAYTENFLDTYYSMIKASFSNDRAQLYEAAKKLNFINEKDSDELINSFADFCMTTLEPFLSPDDPRNNGKVLSDGSYDWKNTDLPQRLSQQVFSMIRNQTWRTPPQEIIFLDRKTGGVFIFLSQLRARFKARDLLLKYLLI